MREKRKTTKKGTLTTVGYCLPLDLVIEILVRLPAKSVVRFKCVSKSWCSIIRSKQFIKAFKSHSRPHLVFSFVNVDKDRLVFFSSPSPSPHQRRVSSSSVSETSTLKVESGNWLFIRITSSVRGFVCCQVGRSLFVVCNPTTGQVIHLARQKKNYNCTMYLGYDPNSDQYKVLLIEYTSGHSVPTEHSVCTLGGRRPYSWRPIKETGIPNYNNTSNWFGTGVCIDGVVYYQYNLLSPSLSSFDFGSEQLRPIKTPEDMSQCLGPIANYLGKLAVHETKYFDYSVILWILDDVKNQVWSKNTYIFSSLTRSMMFTLRFAGITAYGELVYYSPFEFDSSSSSEIFVYDAEKKTERRVSFKRCPRVKRHSSFLPYRAPILCSFVDNIMIL